MSNINLWHIKIHNLLHVKLWVIEACPHMAHHHTSIIHNSLCNKLWHKAIHFYVSLALRMFGKLKDQVILLFNLFLLLFMGLTALFSTIHKSYYTILVNFYIYLQYFHQKLLNFSKISGFQTDLKFVIVFAFGSAFLRPNAQFENQIQI